MRLGEGAWLVSVVGICLVCETWRRGMVGQCGWYMSCVCDLGEGHGWLVWLVYVWCVRLGGGYVCVTKIIIFILASQLWGTGPFTTEI